MAEDLSCDLADPPSEEEFVVESKRPSKAEVYEALIRNKGNLAATMRDLGCRRQVLNDIINSTPAISVLRDELREAMVDKGEENIFADVERGDQVASRFVVQTLGKKRGWATAVEGTGKDGAITVEITRFTEQSEEKQ